MIRQAVVERRTRETEVRVELRLEPGDIKVDTPIRFLNHMLETLIFYMGASGSINAVDLRGFDDHHVVEDVAIVLGTAMDKALGDRVGIARFGWSIVPMDDALALVAVDLGGRSYFVFDGSFSRDTVGDLSTDMIPHFIRSFADSARATVHVKLLGGENEHHKVEAIFKALGLSLRQAMQIVSDQVMSTKGVI
ncbi:imidazoleglycerol-phosphate dehydratase [Vulcanisaeta sp. EB80]|jgi:imidazoleglycerol phosphate dehydratase HisB|uniref:imidazoleglycerol-phosphate dehydratase HisB n=1 Tax=Vulcanisaeta sp. EB80 TaxID=1650660 RepID=UPI0009C101C8|nr:imidazoleglycerol-phosphate dehydratase HisB [Vulcanisaeta sp. EB80]MCG2864951.1 imidazoleglycerol-phosphate dehydratase HisB [Vulcanisaeta sp.]MCG2867042.1 imidazoleglycerol-phosphate dehydratase HisB [Vulcanisaeta sp.]MCG2885836.1 imidazoleglycerol-phosphate dehydratase HisB [Vulcanisaeta sp.]MDT7863677.1 imidazoleglycerol-phosphate dehydratase HisB [Vulcanisaeta sp.]MDT7970069.1 imidazoleglycerol-phosphate dehydratase HisB [Vulcanisaeta sp.]